MSSPFAKNSRHPKAKSNRPDLRLRTVVDEPSVQQKSQPRAVQPRRSRSKNAVSSQQQPRRANSNKPSLVEETSKDQKSQTRTKGLQPRRSLTNIQTEDESVQKKTAKPKKIERKPVAPPKPPPTPKAPDALAPQVDAIIQDFVDHHTNVEKVQEEWELLNTQTVLDEQKHEKCCQNKERNRYPEEVHCLDATRVVLTKENGTEGEFYHANRCKFDGADRDYILAQAPMQNTAEEFWKIIFQEQSPTIVMLCEFYENGKEASEPFWPTKTGEYKYFGTMFVNCKKKETRDKMTYYTIEVLPDGMSNSLITVVYHYVMWPPDKGTRPSQLLDMRRLIKAGESGPMTVVSSRGTGRAAAFTAVDVILVRLFKGAKTRLMDIIIRMRKQRIGSVTDMFHYFHAIHIVLHYLQAKVKKHREAVRKYLPAVHLQLKKCDEKEDKCCHKDEKAAAAADKEEPPSSSG